MHCTHFSLGLIVLTLRNLRWRLGREALGVLKREGWSDAVRICVLERYDEHGRGG